MFVCIVRRTICIVNVFIARFTLCIDIYNMLNVHIQCTYGNILVILHPFSGVVMRLVRVLKPCGLVTAD